MDTKPIGEPFSSVTTNLDTLFWFIKSNANFIESVFLHVTNCLVMKSFTKYFPPKTFAYDFTKSVLEIIPDKSPCLSVMITDPI